MGSAIATWLLALHLGWTGPPEGSPPHQDPAHVDELAPTNPRDTGHITDLLLQMRSGDTQAIDQLFPLVYDELRRLAHAQLRRERPGHTLGTTGLVHET